MKSAPDTGKGNERVSLSYFGGNFGAVNYRTMIAGTELTERVGLIDSRKDGPSL